MPLINQTLLQLLTVKDNFDKLNSSIQIDRFDKEERIVLKQLRKYWNAYEEPTFSMELFTQKFFIDVTCSPKETLFYNTVFKSMLETPNVNVAKHMIRDLRTMEFNKAIEDVQTSYTIGEDIDLFNAIQQLTELYKDDIQKDASNDYCRADVDAVLDDVNAGTALGWKLRCLNDSMPNLRTGNQVIVAMEPGMGKTSFCADNGVFWLKNTIDIFADRPIVWFNNEGAKIKIKGNFIRAGLGMDFPAIKKEGWKVCSERMWKSIGGKDRLRIYDVHNKDTAYLERIIQKDNPFIVFYDMLDAQRIPTARTAREDERLEALYQWARGCAVKYDHLSIPTSQVSFEGSGLQWIPSTALKNSKVAKQGACDSIITIGGKSKPGFEASRYINIAKLFKGSPTPGADPRCRTQVVFEPNTSRYLNPKIV